MIAHPDISLVLRGDTGSSFGSLVSAIEAARGSAVVTNDAQGNSVIATSAPAANVKWTVIAQEPVSEAFAPIRAALWRSLALVVIGAVFAVGLAYWLARRMSGPIRQPEDGALGAVISKHEATLTGFAGDGLMVLVNAPVECENPALRGVCLAVDMQKAVQALIVRWRADVHAVGFGVGAAMGPATVGTVGYEGRTDYTAIGSVVNLASRLCSSASDAQILVDSCLAEAVKSSVKLDNLGPRPIKGYDQQLEVYLAPI